MNRNLLRMNLQRFAEAVPVDDDNKIVDLPAPTPTTVMPSHVAPEAWKNVEDMLVTLSNNVRVQMGVLNDKIEAIETAVSTLTGTVDNTLQEVKSSMAEFKQLLHDATVEVPEQEVKDNEQRKDEQHGRKHQGFLERR